MYDILTRIQGSIIYCIYTCSVVCIVEIKICKKKGKFVIPPPPPPQKKRKKSKIAIEFSTCIKNRKHHYKLDSNE